MLAATFYQRNHDRNHKKTLKFEDTKQTEQAFLVTKGMTYNAERFMAATIIWLFFAEYMCHK
jgi:hypothetical protein